MKSSSFRLGLLLALNALLHPAVQAAEPKFEVQLKKSWIKAYMDRTSIDASMIIRHSHKSPNPVGAGSADGDLHFSGESKDIGLPFVAEIVNAAAEKAADDFVKSTAASNEDNPTHPISVHVKGAWRLWFEHPSPSQVQGAQNAFHPDNTNPDHSFEIHPVSIVTGDSNALFDVSDKIVPVENFSNDAMFDAYEADTAFPYYEGISIVVKASSSGVSIRCPKMQYNYVKFSAQLTQKPKKVADGYIALASVEGGDAESEGLPAEIRLIFIEGSAGATAMASAQKDQAYTLLGVPRLNLNALMALVDRNGTQQFTAKLPYEMIVVGIY